MNSHASATFSLISIYSNPPKIQEFSLPENLIFHISKNPFSAKVYNKLIKTCKYFYLNGQIIIFENLAFTDTRGCYKSSWFRKSEINECIISNTYPYFNINNEKIWIIDVLEITRLNDRNMAYFLASKLHRGDVRVLDLANQNLTLDEFLLFNSTGRVGILKLRDTIIKSSNNDGDGKIVPIETLISNLEDLHTFELSGTYVGGNNYFTSETAKKLLEIPHFIEEYSFSSFIVHQVPEIFDFETFIEGLKETDSCMFDIHLYYDNSISEAYKQRLQKYVNKLISVGRSEVVEEFRPPKIRFPGMTTFSKKRLNEMFEYYQLLYN